MNKKIVAFVLAAALYLTMSTAVTFAADDTGTVGPRCVSQPISYITLSK